MKIFKKLLAFVLALALIVSVGAPSVYAAAADDLEGSNFALKITESESSITVALECNKALTAFGAASGDMSILNSSGEDASSYFTLTGIAAGVLQDVSTETGNPHWGASAKNSNTGDSMEAGDWVIYSYTVSEEIPDDEYTFKMTFGDDMYSVSFDEYSCMEAVVTTTYTVDTTGGYSAALTTSASNNEVVSEGEINVNVAVSHSTDTVFNAGEIKLTYDSSKLTPNTNSLDSMVTDGTLSGYKVNDNELVIEDFGGDKSMSTDASYSYSIPFTAGEVSEETTDTVKLTRAAFIHKDNASSSDLIEAAKSPESLIVTIKVAMVNVTLTNSADNDETTTTATKKGAEYTFAPNDTANYTYSDVKATVNGDKVDVADNGNGTFTIAGEDVTGDIALTYTKTAKNYRVTYEGEGAGELTNKPERATYGQNLTVALPDDIPAGTGVGYTYGISAKIGETTVGTYDDNTRTLTIQGTDITDNIIITVTKKEVTATQVTITVSGDSGLTIKDVTGNKTTVNKGSSVTLVLTEEAGYTYNVVDGNNEKVTFTDGEYTFTANESETFNVTKTLDVSSVAVTEYVKVNNYVVYLVTYGVTLADGKVPTYDRNMMFWSDKYEAYCWLVIDSTLTADAAKAKIDVQVGTKSDVDYSMDINNTGITDAADAQLVWNMYNAMYSDFNTVSMAQFLAADQNAASDNSTNWGLSVQDAQVIITAILDGTATN